VPCTDFCVCWTQSNWAANTASCVAEGLRLGTLRLVLICELRAEGTVGVHWTGYVRLVRGSELQI
jgi:hypothetical protein